MGCCVSCRREASSNSAPPTRRRSLEFSDGSREPPPEMEEETVKEVLSVISTHKPILQLNQEKQIQNPVLKEIERDNEIEKMIISNAVVVEESSVVSEICSLSETISAASVTGKEYGDDEVCQKLNRSPTTLRSNKSFASNQVLKKDRLVGKSPTGRSDQYTARRHAGSAAPLRIVQNVDSGSGVARRCPMPELPRRDRGENSTLRSRSPATAPGATRSSPVRSGRSPGRTIISSPPESNQKEAEDIKGINVNYSPDTTNESLENPLVSLECFIFL